MSNGSPPSNPGLVKPLDQVTPVRGQINDDTIRTRFVQNASHGLQGPTIV